MPPAVPTADLDHVLAHTEGLWEALRGQNIFVTGGTGFFGRWLLETFAYANERLGLGAHLAALTRNPDAAVAKAPALAASPAIRFIRGDVRHLSRDSILPHLPQGHSGEFAYIIHAATESGSTLGQDDPLAMFDTVVHGTRAALDFAVASGTTRFLLTSSGAVYGRQPSELTHVPESYVGAPDCMKASSAYGEGKRAAELLCACYHGNHPMLQPLIARCFAFVGPFLPLDVHFAIGNFIRDLLRGGPVRVAGDGSPYRSYLYAADLAAWLWTILFRGEPLLPYNVGSDDAIDIEALANLVAWHGEPRCEVSVAKKRNSTTAPARYVPDVTRITSSLHVSQWIGLEDSIGRTINFHRQELTY
jgi:dTDP-glucose 4,6-dehydratase